MQSSRKKRLGEGAAVEIRAGVSHRQVLWGQALQKVIEGGKGGRWSVNVPSSAKSWRELAWP